MPRVSVNIPCYNSEKFIRETIESVLNQTYGDFEIIVADDGSSDNTGDIVRSLRDSRIRYFYKENEGLAETRNKAITASAGEYIAFLDHDDIWLPGKLGKQIALAEKDNSVGLIFSNSYVKNKEKMQKATYFDRLRPKKGFILEDLLFDMANFIPLSTVMMRRNIFEDIGYFNRNFKIGEEYELFLRVAEKYEFDYVDEPLAVYRIHEHNFSNRKDIFIKEALDILNIWKDKRPDIYARNRKRLHIKEAALLYDVANFYALKSDKKKSLSYFKLSLDKYSKINVIVKKFLLSMLGCGGYRFFSAIFNKLRYGI